MRRFVHHRPPCRRVRPRRRGVILAVVLVMIGLLALSMAGFLFFVRAETAGIVAGSEGQQARLAADSGFEELVTYLRLDRHNVAVWYDNPRFHNALVWGDGFKRDADPLKQYHTRPEMLASGERIPAAFRYSIVAERLDGPDGTFRYGVMPEAGKLNLNTASEQQITQLIGPLLGDLGVDNPQEIIDAILDWRDGDDEQRPNGAENEYYQRLTPAYNAKNGRFDTVEELLLVKGVSAAVLFGEDTNRNGILDANEDDGEATFPYYDNADGRLNRGIAPYLTVYSREVDTALDNKPRINLNADGATIRKQIDDVFKNGELSAATIAFLTNLQGAGINPALLKSPADLFPPGPDEEFESARPPTSAPTDEESDGGAGGGSRNPGEQSVDPAKQPTTRAVPGGSNGRTTGDRPATSGGIRPVPRGGKTGAAEKSMQDTGSKGGKDNDVGGKGGAGTDGKGPASAGGNQNGAGGRRGGNGPAGGNGAAEGDEKTPEDQADGSNSTGDRNGRPTQNRGGGQRGGGGGGSSITPESMFNALKNSPVMMEELPFLMDRFSTRPPQQAAGLIEGLVNINAAPYRVLLTIPGITPEAAGKLVASRSTPDPTTLATTAWPLTSGALDGASWKKIAPYITTKAYQFHVEIVGYADHVKTSRRYEWIIEMVGPMPQVKYFRDLTFLLGFAWPVDDDTQVVTK